jgi:hypothetical protein
MYELYEEKCIEQNRCPVKDSMYRNIFNNEFNLSFHKPKNDRCDTCEFFKISNPNDIEYLNHLQLKTSIRNDRNIDRENSDEITICFDLQRVITCHKSFISNFYYKRKINVYNLTAHESINKTGFCCVWDESLCGRSGNDIASSLIKILEKIFEMYPNIKSFKLWSDSCVAQDKNSIMTFALMNFMRKNKQINYIVMKFSWPGHSSIQEVDNIHSVLDKSFENSEYFSFENIKRLIKTAKKKIHFK